MPSLEDVNKLVAAGCFEFSISSFDGQRLLIVGSRDLCYYHNVELVFDEVTYINCPVDFHDPQFAKGQERFFEIQAEGENFSIAASAVSIDICTVFHYDRGELLQPGERIADWVFKKKT
jgi:hypothetical protein